MKKRKAEVVDGPQLKYPDVFQAVITNLSVITVMKDIKDRLSSQQLKMFRQTCFGMLLNIQNIKFSGVLAQSFLLREIVKDDAKPQEMWFDICGQEVRFGVMEFGLVTGLSFHEPAVIKDQGSKNNLNSVRNKYFTKSGPISYNDFRDKFRGTVWEEEDDEMTVKMSLLYCLYLFLLGNDKRKVLDDEVLELVENLALFNAYPWGHRIWNMTFDSLNGALKGRYQKYVRKVENNLNFTEKFNLFGFPIAFQVSTNSFMFLYIYM